MDNRCLSGLLLAALLIVVLAGSCADPLPEDPGLYLDDLGIGISLGQPAEAAREAVSAGDPQISVLSGEEFAQTNPYEATDKQSTFVYALYTTGMEELKENTVIVADPVTCIKVFPVEGQDSPVEVMGTGLSQLSPDSLEGLLGLPKSRTESSDGATHMSYTFGSEDLSDRSVSATFSFRSSGSLFAMELALTSTN